MNMLNLTEEDIIQLRSSIPQGFKACPHWDNRIRFFQKDGRPAVLFCCNRPDFNGDSGPIGEGLQRSQTCIVNWGFDTRDNGQLLSKDLDKIFAAKSPIIGYLYLDEWPTPRGHAILYLDVGIDTLEPWERVNQRIDNGEFSRLD